MATKKYVSQRKTKSHTVIQLYACVNENVISREWQTDDEIIAEMSLKDSAAEKEEEASG